jgi:2-amino-4-hydroxy-6-hydroxymethyldihydropteridine diphosphokinase/dihydropteroate synthase
MGDRVAMIERACRELESNGKVDIIQTSSLWESKAMYVVDQDNFVNGACEVCYVFTLNLYIELTQVDRDCTVTN